MKLIRKFTVFIFTLIVLIINGVNASPIVYIPLGSGNQVIEVDAVTDTITATYTDVENPHGLVATPDGEYVIAGSLKETPLKEGQDKTTLNSVLALIHPAHGHVMGNIAVPGWTHHQAITPDGRYVISTHPTRGGISVVDLQNNNVSKTIATGMTPNYTVVLPDGSFAYVSNSGSNTISEINLTNWTVTRSLESGPAPEHIALSGDNTQLFVTNPRAGNVSAVSIKSGKITQSWHLGDQLHGLDVGDDGKTIFVTSKKDEKLKALDTTTGKVINETALSPAPYHLNTISGTGI